MHTAKECHSSLKRKDILTPATTRMNLRTSLSVREAGHGEKHCDPTHRRPLEESDPQRQEVDGGARGWGRGGESVFNGDRGSVGKVRKFWGHGRWWWLHNSVNGLNAAELYVQKRLK